MQPVDELSEGALWNRVVARADPRHHEDFSGAVEGEGLPRAVGPEDDQPTEMIELRRSALPGEVRPPIQPHVACPDEALRAIVLTQKGRVVVRQSVRGRYLGGLGRSESCASVEAT